jgi:hypothetical protein
MDCKTGVTTLTVSVIGTLCVSSPLVPVMVSAYVPGAALELADRVSVDVPDENDVGLNDPLAPLANPEADNATVPL